MGNISAISSVLSLSPRAMRDGKGNASASMTACLTPHKPQLENRLLSRCSGFRSVVRAVAVNDTFPSTPRLSKTSLRHPREGIAGKLSHDYDNSAIQFQRGWERFQHLNVSSVGPCVTKQHKSSGDFKSVRKVRARLANGAEQRYLFLL